MTTLELRLNRLPLLPFQLELLRSNARNRSVWGGYGSAKSTAAAYAFLRHCVENPWTEAYGPNDRPFSFILGPTHKSLTESAHRILRSLIPDALVARDRKSPDWFLELTNGHQIRFRTIASNLEGSSACGLWADEVHMIPSESTWINFRSRVRDGRARSHLVLTSGLPVDNGWCRDHFDKPEFAGDPDRMSLFVSSRDNPYLPAHVLADLLASVSKGNVANYIDGQWIAPDGVIYHEFSATPHRPLPFASGGHLWDYRGDRAQPVLLGVDIGEQSVVSIWQEVKRRIRRPSPGTPGGYTFAETMGLHMVDELYIAGEPMEAVCRAVKARGWNVDPRASKAYADPTTRSTEIAAIRRELNIPTIQAIRGQDEENLEWGYDHVNWALRDADDNVRVTFAASLPRGRHTLLDALPKYHRGANGKARRDDVLDHHVDAMRYPIVHVLKAAHRAGRR